MCWLTQLDPNSSLTIDHLHLLKPVPIVGRRAWGNLSKCGICRSTGHTNAACGSGAPPVLTGRRGNPPKGLVRARFVALLFPVVAWTCVSTQLPLPVSPLGSAQMTCFLPRWCLRRVALRRAGILTVLLSAAQRHPRPATPRAALSGQRSPMPARRAEGQGTAPRAVLVLLDR